MSAPTPMPPRPPIRRRAPTFSPRFTVSLFYLFGLFFLYCFVLITPALYEITQTIPPGPEQEEAAKIAAQKVVQPRLMIAVAASVFTVALGGYFKLLPGLRERRLK